MTITVLKNSYQQEIFTLNSILVGIRENFSEDEFKTFATHYASKYRNMPLEYFENINSLDKGETGYAYKLALYHRIFIPLKNSAHTPYKVNATTHKNVPTIVEMEYLLSKYFDEFVYDNSYRITKDTLSHSAKALALRLWFAGYTLFSTTGRYPVTDDTIVELQGYFTRNKGNAFVAVRFLSYALEKEKSSLVKKVITITRPVTPLLTREQNKWKLVQECEYKDTFQTFILDFVYSLTQESKILNIPQSDGNTINFSKDKIVSGTFVEYSVSLRNLLNDLCDRGYYTTESIIKNGIFDIICNVVPTYSRTKGTSIKIVAKLWLLYYSAETKTYIDVNRIVPVVLTRRTTSFGKVLDYDRCVTLIDELLNENSPFHKDSNIIQYRCRYITLLQLSTGQRVSELCLLSQKCVKHNNQGVPFIEFHKRKGHDSHTIQASKDALEYINKLMIVAPRKKISVPSTHYRPADDLTIYRLVANNSNNSPLTQEDVNTYLRRLNNYLFKDYNKNNAITSHDLRRMRAVYMKLKNYTNEDIEKQLGHSSLSSQVPYLQTKPLFHQQAFADIYEQGVYSRDDAVCEINNASQAMNKNADNRYLIDQLLKSIDNANNYSFSTQEPLSFSEPKGFPIGNQFCSADLSTNCGKSEIMCFGCDNYNPDPNSVHSHLAELLRYDVYIQYVRKHAKRERTAIQKLLLENKASELENRLNEAYTRLEKSFGLTEGQIKTIKEKAVQISLRKVYTVPNIGEALKIIGGICE